MFGSNYAEQFGLPIMPDGWDLPARPLQWQGIDSNPMYGPTSAGMQSGQPVPGAPPPAPPPGAAPSGPGAGSANPSVPALVSGSPLAQGGSLGPGAGAPAAGATGSRLSYDPAGGGLNAPSSLGGGGGLAGPGVLRGGGSSFGG